MNKFIFLMLFFYSYSASALDCKQAISTPDVNACGKIELDKFELKLNLVYQRVLKKMDEISRENSDFADKSKLKKSFVEAQRLWVKFRKADCDTTYTYWSDGTIRGAMYLSCMTSRAEQRIKELKMYEETY
jgi:uncharacterized protein YecT (DUF1311 family)